jgi:large subunit ribosomal protein L4
MAEIKVKLYNWQGQEIGQESLDPKIFGVKIKPSLVQEVLIFQGKNSRESIANTKGRGEVRGGGKKPWKQKGTGRARHGSIRSPLWVGGGVTFGPTSERNFAVKVNKKLKNKALAMVLSDKVANERLILVESYNLPEAKTKILKKTLEALPTKNKSVLIVTKSAQENIVKAASNLPRTETIYYGSLNIVDLLKKEYLLVSKELIDKIKEHYS